MKSSSLVLVGALLLGSGCESSGSDAAGATGGAASGGGASGGVSSGGGTNGATGGEASGPASGGAAAGSGGSSDGSGGGEQKGSGGAGGAPPGENDPSCPDELPEHEATCFVYPFIVCSYEAEAAPSGANCVCAALKWDCTGCPAAPIQGELSCAGYEGETCGGCTCTEASPNWDCGDEF